MTTTNENSKAMQTIAERSLRNAAADAAEALAEARKERIDCATPRCKREPALTHLGKPLCQACWERQCQEQENGQATASVAAPEEHDGAASAAKETTMSKKNSSKKAPKTTKTTKASKPAKAAAQAKPKVLRQAAADAKPRRVSALDAAAQVLQAAAKPMSSTEMIVAMAEQGLWQSPNGKTPHATLYAAILREINAKGGQARFRKADRGLFEYAG